MYASNEININHIFVSSLKNRNCCIIIILLPVNFYRNEYFRNGTPNVIFLPLKFISTPFIFNGSNTILFMVYCTPFHSVETLLSFVIP